MARVLARHASGFTLRRIAEDEYASERSIKETVSQARKILGASTMAQAVLIAHKIGYLTLPDDSGIVHAQSPYGVD